MAMCCLFCQAARERHWVQQGDSIQQEQGVKSDLGIRQDVNDEPFWEPTADTAAIGMEVDNGIVTLTGHVCSYVEKPAAEHIAECVVGVRSVVQKIEVRLPGTHTDADVAQAVRAALEWQVVLPSNRIEALVENGRMMPLGEVGRPYQSEQAIHAVGLLRGITDLINQLQIKARVIPASIAEQIGAALKQYIVCEAGHIRVSIDGGTVTFSGYVGSASEWRAAEGAAWFTPGVTQVVDHFQIVSQCGWTSFGEIRRGSMNAVPIRKGGGDVSL